MEYSLPTLDAIIAATSRANYSQGNRLTVLGLAKQLRAEIIAKSRIEEARKLAS